MCLTKSLNENEKREEKEEEQEEQVLVVENNTYTHSKCATITSIH